MDINVIISLPEHFNIFLMLIHTRNQPNALGTPILNLALIHPLGLTFKNHMGLQGTQYLVKTFDKPLLARKQESRRSGRRIGKERNQG